MSDPQFEGRSSHGALLIDLADRCEAASEPHRVLDREIALATRHPALAYETLEYAIDECGYHVRPFTASIDAATALVPVGWAWMVRDDGLAVTLRKKGNEDGCYSSLDGFTARTATPALAICAAALRARAASVDTRPQGGDANAAPFTSGAVPEGQTPTISQGPNP